MIEDLALTDYERRIVAHVEEHGCHVTYVFGNEDDDFVDFAYSVGFPSAVQQGEVIAFGLPQEIMQFMINQTLHQCREGLVLNDGVRISGLLEGFDVIARHVAPEHMVREYFNSALWFHRRIFGTELKSAYQLVWPGAADGLFPWDVGCAERVIQRQPPLYQARSYH